MRDNICFEIAEAGNAKLLHLCTRRHDGNVLFYILLEDILLHFTVLTVQKRIGALIPLKICIIPPSPACFLISKLKKKLTLPSKQLYAVLQGLKIMLLNSLASKYKCYTLEKPSGRFWDTLYMLEIRKTGFFVIWIVNLLDNLPAIFWALQLKIEFWKFSKIVYLPHHQTFKG